MLTLVLSTCLALASQTAHLPFAEQAYSFSPAIVQLQGHLVRASHADDRDDTVRKPRIPYLALLLDKPIKVAPTPGADPKHTADLDQIEHLQRIQLLFSTDAEQARAKTMVGHVIRVSGSLEEAVAPMQFTPATLTVKDFQPR